MQYRPHLYFKYRFRDFLKSFLSHSKNKDTGNKHRKAEQPPSYTPNRNTTFRTDNPAQDRLKASSKKISAYNSIFSHRQSLTRAKGYSSLSFIGTLGVLLAPICLGIWTLFLSTPFEAGAVYSLHNDFLSTEVNKYQLNDNNILIKTPKGTITLDKIGPNRWFVLANFDDSAVSDFSPLSIKAIKHDYAPSSSFIQISSGRPSVLTANGEQKIPLPDDIKILSMATPYTDSKLNLIAEGLRPADTFMASRSQAQPSSFNFQPILPILTGDISQRGQLNLNGVPYLCRTDRIETATWLSSIRTTSKATYSFNAKQYKTLVEKFSNKYSLSPSLVYAIMRIESAFNPTAISKANALGLMQIVPDTAGGEVYRFLNGTTGLPEAHFLFTPENNIHYGTVYLHLLSTRYFKEVKNPLSREICVISAYNGGPGTVYRVFDKDKEKDKVISAINELSPEELYSHLIKVLPTQENREYLVKVTSARNKFHGSLGAS